MKKRFITAALIFMSVCAVAQQKENRDANGKILRGPYETNRAFDNWFFSVGGGVNIYEGEYDSKADFGKRLAPALDVSIGKWITPWSGVRLQFAGLKVKGATQPGAIFADGTEKDYTKKKFDVMTVHADYLWNLSNAFLGYNSKRVWNFIPYGGFGWVQAKGNGHEDNELAGFVGILNTFRLGKRVDLTLEGRQMLVNQRLDGVVGGEKVEGMTSVTLGLNFKLGKTGFNRVTMPEPVDFSSYNDRINDLRAQNDKLKADNQQLSDELIAARNRKAETVTEVITAPLALFFQIGKAKLDSKELTNLDYYATHIMKAASDKTFTLIGSADKATGSKAWNQKLSEKRADYVYNLLVEKYGIPAERLVKRAEGDTNNRFKEAVLNRVVIVE
ncbi:OmpA family protein [Bacteroides pyogenes]|uniref:OmpA family protein n=1 Tax=Bacteroides pyogenes TaxID=310300 RepID=UPI0003DC3CAF|nr:OmpA family protein [Bacteroides pyogenes]MBB3896316.1 outer membrane protein OmpA-like peptidoglycan-associated protein [Bacteroides pyogenes]GAE23430.1 outer membrane porin F precursor [Bacteroides pyogenes JCM 10003]SUV31051.1 Outer membrane protein and related peptidoglycan-associated (lipo)proteins [Bacteroides pyogenes]